MSAADEAARLREQADALDAEAKLESELLAAKEGHRKKPDDVKAKERKRAASGALTQHRAARREDAVVIGGDAFMSNDPTEG